VRLLVDCGTRRRWGGSRGIGVGLVLALSVTAAPGRAQQYDYKRPVEVAPTEQTIGEGYVTPKVQRPRPRATAWQIADVALMGVALGLAAWLALWRRQRGALVALTAACLLYFGFYREGCVCPIGSTQNVAVALVDPSYAVPHYVILLLVPSANPDGHVMVADWFYRNVGTPFEVSLRFFASPDVFDHFVATERQQFDRARDARFTLSTPCVRDCSLVIRARGQDRVLGTLPLDGGVRGLVTPELRFHIDSMTKEDDLVAVGTYAADSVKLRILTTIIWLYGQVAPILTGILVVTLVAAPIAAAFSYRSTLLVPILTLVGAAIARIGLIAVIDATSFPSIILQYLGPAHALLLLAGLLACVEMWSIGGRGWSWRGAP